MKNPISRLGPGPAPWIGIPGLGGPKPYIWPDDVPWIRLPGRGPGI